MAGEFGLWSRASWLGAVALGCAAVAACSGDGGEAPPAPVARPTVPAPPALRRLLASHYRRTIAHLLGDAAASVATPPSDTQLNGYTTIAASQLAFNDALASAYEGSARKVAAAAMLDAKRIDALLGCKPTQVADAACLGAFVGTFGRLAFRRPLTSVEREEYVALGRQVALEKNAFYDGVAAVLAAMLQSPNFLYQIELGKPDPSRTDVRVLDGYEVASRLAFFLTGRGPTGELLDAAAAGELDDEEGVRTWAEKLVASDAAGAAMRDFFGELLVLGELETLARDPSLFPEFSPELATSMREEALRIVEDVVARDAPFGELLTTERTFLDERLAAFYGVPAPSEPWGLATLPPEQGRSGVLTSAAVMTRQAHGTATSATYRGLFVMERFLCTTMPPPPPGVVTTLPPSSAAPTLRERLAVHQTEEVCRACHYMADGIGLTFENFDAIGRFRSEENGAPIEAHGEVEQIGAWSNPRELGALLAGSDVVEGCLVRQLLRFGTGHVEVKGEWPTIDRLTKSWAAGGHRFRALLVDVASSPLFRTVGAIE